MTYSIVTKSPYGGKDFSQLNIPYKVTAIEGDLVTAIREKITVLRKDKLENVVCENLDSIQADFRERIMKRFSTDEDSANEIMFCWASSYVENLNSENL